MTVYCVVLDVGDEDMIDGRDRRMIVCENRQLKRGKEQVVEENKTFAEKLKAAKRKEALTEIREKGEKLLRIGYALDKGGGERVSVM